MGKGFVNFLCQVIDGVLYVGDDLSASGAMKAVWLSMSVSLVGGICLSSISSLNIPGVVIATHFLSKSGFATVTSLVRSSRLPF